VFVGRSRPHHIGLRRVWLGVPRVALHHALGLGAYDHHVRACFDPVVVPGLFGGERVGIAGAVVSIEHVDEAELLRRWPLRLPGAGANVA
jgi:hypothetical protein